MRVLFCRAVLGITLCFAFTAPAASLIVTSLADSGPGTLRDRIATANPGDTIQFGVIGKILLNSQLTISTNLRIEGPGIQFLTISGNNASRVFDITGGNVGIFRMLIADGRVQGTNGAVGAKGENVQGGGIRIANGATLGLSSVIISNNTVIGGTGGSQNQFGSSGSGGNGLGGGIANAGNLTLVQSQLAANTAKGGQGGPVTDGESPGVGGQGWGGGLYNENSAYVTQATLFDNHAIAGTGLGGTGGSSGGGIYNVAALQVVLCTIASNTASGSGFDFGGGIGNVGTLFVRDATIAGNQAGFGGGIDGGGDIGNTILALNHATSGPDGQGSFNSSDYNFVQNTNSLTLSGATTHNITGLDPLLGPLRDNGGFELGFATLTMAVLPGSPVIDQGKTTSGHDLRGAPRPFDIGSVNNAPGGDASDIGAFEFGLPVLGISSSPSDVVLFWPRHYADYILESKPALSDGNPWIELNDPAIPSDQLLKVTIDASGGNRFFRLRTR